MFSKHFSVNSPQSLIRINAKRFILFCFTILSFTKVSAQYDIPEKPSLETSVYDYIALLSETEKSSLENKLIRYS